MYIWNTPLHGNIETLGFTMIGQDEHIHIYMKKNSLAPLECKRGHSSY